MTSVYDSIGQNYSHRRTSDPRIAAAIETALTGCESILNVGAGTGSYEPRSAQVFAAELSRTMIRQRPIDAAPCVQARAEALPFQDSSFDAALAVLTVHHWQDQSRGLSECCRVAKSRVIVFTNDFDVCANFWLFDYLPGLLQADRHLFMSMGQYEELLGPVELIAVPIPADCTDGFLGAYWKRPRAYLDPSVRESISTFSKIGNIDAQLERLERDIESGEWDERYSDITKRANLDLGYRVVTAASRKPAC